MSHQENSTSVIVPAAHGRAFRVEAGQALRIVNTHGTQVVDCWAWNAYDLEEFMCMETTRVWNQRLCPAVGESFVTNHRHPILTIAEDTSPGVHDTFMAACDRRRYELLGVAHYHRNCCDNMMEGMFSIGLTPPRRLLASFNVFMNIRVQQDGNSLATLPTVTGPGDFITLRAEMDCFVSLSACPQDIVNIQGRDDNTPRPVEVQLLRSGVPNHPVRGPWVPESVLQRGATHTPG
jgi:uncharacterized protein YcgI (DUF1989 family)